MRPRLVAGLSALLILTGTVFAGAAPAAAADFDPALGGSSSPARQFKINVLGKILGKAAPTSWQREQLANSNRYNQAWETLEAMYGTSANNGYSGPPDSYEDYVIRKKEIETTGKITVKGPGGTTTTQGSGKTFTAPATGPNKLVKGAAGTATAISGVAFGLQLGNGAADLGLSLFGMTKEGLVCAEDVSDGIKTWASLVNGVDCDALAAPSEFIPNTDADTGTTTKLDICDPQGFCWSFTGQASGPAYFNQFVTAHSFCFSGNGAGAQNQMSVLYLGNTQSGERVRQLSNIVTTGTGQYSVCPGGGGAAITTYGDEYQQVNPEILCAIQSNGRSCDEPGSVKPEVIEGSANPERTIVCTIVGTDGKTYSAESAAYTEEDGSIAAPECPSLPDGVAPASGSLEQKNQETGATTELAPIDVNQEFLDWWKDNPECRTGACAQELYKIENGQKVDCFENTAKCADWFEDPNREQNYECWYNDKKVEQSNCYVYSGMFKPGRLAAGTPYSDPLTGVWSGGQNTTAVDQKAYGMPVADPNSMRSCIREVGAANPIEWVMVPVQCALQWAFVPRPAPMMVNASALTESWNKTTFGKLGAYVGSLKINTEVTGCGGIPLDLPFLYERGVPQLSFGAACPGTMTGTIAAIIKVVLTALITWAGIVAISRHVAGVINYRGIE